MSEIKAVELTMCECSGIYKCPQHKVPNIPALIARIRRANSDTGMPLLSSEMAEIIQVLTHLEQKCAELVKALVWIKEDIKCDRKEDVIIRYIDEVLERYGK